MWFKLDDIKKTKLSKKKFEKYELINNDFLIVRSNGNPNLVGKCAVWDKKEPFVYASYLIRFRFDILQVEPRYIMYFLMSPHGKNLLKPQVGGGTYNISSTDFQKVQIPYIDIEIQRYIVDELNAKMEILEGLQKMKAESEKKINQILADVWGTEYVEPKVEEVEE